MTFNQTLIITVLDKAIIGGLLLFAGWCLNRSIEKYKSQLEFRKQTATAREAAYRRLWALTQMFSPSLRADLSQERRDEVAVSLRSWYYTDGNGIYLSRAAADLCFKARELLTIPGEDIERIRQAFSALRTQLKLDVGVYDTLDAQTQIGSR